MQWYAEPEPLFDVPPSCFVPRPKVTSSVIRLRRREKPPVEVGDEKLMFRVIRAAFNQRRKTLVNALSSQLGVLDKENAARVLVNCGFDTKNSRRNSRYCWFWKNFGRNIIHNRRGFVGKMH